MVNSILQAIRKVFASTAGKVIDDYISNHRLNVMLVHGDRSRLHLGKDVIVNNALFNTASGDIVVEDHVFFGHNVCLLTGTHEITAFGAARQGSIPQAGRDIVIKTGVWIASNATVLGPCVIGEHSVVACASLVNKDVPPYTVVGGVPARIISEISPETHCRDSASAEQHSESRTIQSIAPK